MILVLAICIVPGAMQSQDDSRKIDFPDAAPFLTLVTDLHIHTVFSDGYVWPTIRVDEAVRDGLDAIALTEHIEYQPWKEDVKHEDRNRSYQLASQAAKAHDLLVIHGAEITRSKPPGHANALFVKDVNALITEDAKESYRKAREQGAFIFWNHPHWVNQQKDAIPKLSPMHYELIEEDLLHGLEVVNDLTFSEEGMAIANNNDLVVIGTSDIHGLIDYQFDIPGGGHRPVTLVFAEERSVESIREALFAGRTVTWFNQLLAGKKENMKLLIDACLEFKSKDYVGDSELLQLVVRNRSDAKFILKNNSVYNFHRHSDLIEIEPQSRTVLQIVSARSPGLEAALSFEILNAVIGYKENYVLEIELEP